MGQEIWPVTRCGRERGLREAIAVQLGIIRGISCTADQVYLRPQPCRQLSIGFVLAPNFTLLAIPALWTCCGCRRMTAAEVDRLRAPVAAKALRIMMEGERRAPVSLQPHPLCGSNVRDFRVRKAILLMERTMENPVSPDVAAQHVGVGRRQLERLFRSELGQTPSDFSVALRLQRAHQMLRSTP